jgi:hypothetical protein
MLMGARWNAGQRENLGRINKWGYLPLIIGRVTSLLYVRSKKYAMDPASLCEYCAQALQIDSLANIATMKQFGK